MRGPDDQGAGAVRSAQCADGLGLVADSIALWASQPREIAVSDLKLDGVFFFSCSYLRPCLVLKKILQYPSYRIFGHIHAVEKITSYSLTV